MYPPPTHSDLKLFRVNYFFFTHKLNSAKAIHYTYMFFLVFKYIDPHFGFHPMEHFLVLLINIFVSRLNSGSLQ